MRALVLAFILALAFMVATATGDTQVELNLTLPLNVTPGGMAWATYNLTLPVSTAPGQTLWSLYNLTLPVLSQPGQLLWIRYNLTLALSPVYSHCPVLRVYPDTLYPYYPANLSLLVWAVNTTQVEVYVDGAPAATTTITSTSNVTVQVLPRYTGLNVTALVAIEGDGNYTCPVSPRVDNRTVFQALSWSYDGIELVATGTVVYENSSVPARNETMYVLVNNQTVATLTINNGGFRVTLNPPPNSTVALRLEHGETRTYRVTGMVVWPGGATGVPPLSLHPTAPGLGSAGEIYVALTAIAIYLYFATRWNDPFLALVPFGAIMSAYGSYAGSTAMLVTGAGGIIAGFLLKYLRG